MFCWSAPLIQQLTAPNGNISALLRNSSPGPTGGLTFGFQAVAASIQPAVVWWVPFSRIKSLSVATTWPVASGLVALVLIVAFHAAAVSIASAIVFPSGVPRFFSIRSCRTPPTPLSQCTRPLIC